MTSLELIPALESRLVLLGDGRDVRSINELVAYRADYDAIQRCISGLPNAPSGRR